MNWDAVSAIGQLIGSLVVLVTLMYLAIQVRHAERTMRRAIRQERFQAVRELLLNRANSGELSRGILSVNGALGAPTPRFVDVVVQRASISPEVAFALLFEQMAWWQYRQHVLADLDELPPGERRDFELAVRSHYAPNTIGALWYELNRAGLNDDATRRVDEILALTPTATQSDSPA